MNVNIELFEKTYSSGYLNLIAECNGYINGELVIQFSRSPFQFADTITDQDVIDFLASNDYEHYFNGN